ncbi:MAG: SprT-like domain-containing protein [Cyclobacteriaceae bacterium]
MNFQVNKEDWSQLLKDKVPERALSYCYTLWEEEPFSFTISRSRSSKLGDFRYRSDQKIQKITINHDLNPYQFLITFIHEVAHHRVYSRYKTNTKPHGQEWKSTFRFLMGPVLHDRVFPKDILIPLRLHMNNPKASTGADFFLMKELKKYDAAKGSDGALLLGDLKIGALFELKARIFLKLETRRTRVLCKEVATGKRYLISSHAEVELQD